jgi:membrane protein implicated in regulation of membrane protease activity
MSALSDIWHIGPLGLHAFWVWLTLGVVLLAIEVFLGTQWLLWSAAAAGIVAVICLTGLPLGLAAQVAIFAVLSLGMALLTRRFLKTGGGHADINDQPSRYVGRQATVLSGFDVTGGDQTGRVLFEGVEWPAVLRTDTPLIVANDTPVVIERVHEGRLYVRVV